MSYNKINVFHFEVCYNIINGGDYYKVNIFLPTSEWRKNNSKWFTLMTDTEETVLKSDNLDYDATISLSKPTRKSLSLKFKLHRKITRSVIQYILPPGMLVLVSWVS